MKHILLTTIAVVVLVGCGSSVDIHQAAATGNIEAVKQHLANGTDVNAKGLRETTPLHGAAFFGEKEIVELLIAKGAYVNAKNKPNGWTPLDWTGINGDHATADLLRKHGAKTAEELKAEGK